MSLQKNEQLNLWQKDPRLALPFRSRVAIIFDAQVHHLEQGPKGHTTKAMNFDKR
jgi:hypothetical protein